MSYYMDAYQEWSGDYRQVLLKELHTGQYNNDTVVAGNVWGMPEALDPSMTTHYLVLSSQSDHAQF